MDLDDESVYDYLEKETETAAAGKDCNGEGEGKDAKEGGGGRSSSAKRRTDEEGQQRGEHRSKRPRGEEEDKDRDRSDRRHRSSSSSRHDRDKDRDKRHRSVEDKADKDRDKDRDRRSSRRDEKDRDRRRDKDKDEPSEKKEHKENEFRSRPRERRDKREGSAPAESEPDPERDQRTVFAWQICLKADEKHVYDFFSQAGKVRDVRLIMDRNSRRSKGVGYIEFYDAASVPKALQLSGQPLLGQAVMVKTSEAEKNLAHSASGGGGAGFSSGPYPGGARRLYVGNLHVNITEPQLRQVFEPFGAVELVQVPTDSETGLCKGYAFVQYQKLEDARSAQLSMNGILELAGRPIKVSAVTDQQTGQDIGNTQNDLDDDEGGGLALNARSRALLMQKLDRSGVVPGAAAVPPPMPFGSSPLVASTMMMPNGLAVPEEPIGAPSECLLLKNMFDPDTETEPDFDMDIKSDVQEECSKFGPVKHISVDRNSYGHVYVRFNAAIHALAAQQALHKRWFAGKLIQATFMPVHTYEAQFPSSKHF